MLGLKCHLVTCRHSLNYRIKTLKSASKFHKKNEPDSWFKTHEVNFGGYWRSPKIIEPLNRVFLKMYYILPHQHPGILDSVLNNFHSKFCSRYEGDWSPRTIEFQWVTDKVTRHHQEVIKIWYTFSSFKVHHPFDSDDSHVHQNIHCLVEIIQDGRFWKTQCPKEE